MKILVTGAAGFIGVNLSRYLLDDRSHIVVAVDSLTDAGNLGLLADLESNDRFVFTKADICNVRAISYNLPVQKNKVVERVYRSAVGLLKRLCIASICLVVLSWAISKESSTFAQGPENTLVVVNADSPPSMAVANRFIDLRSIPAANVVYLSGITYDEKFGDDSGNSEDFLKQIARPVMKAIKDRKLSNQISCITYSAGFPTRFNTKPEAEKYRVNRGLAPNKIWIRTWASITSLTYLYNDVFSPKPQYFLDPNANRYANLPSKSWLKNPFVGEPAKRFDRAQSLIKNEDYVGAGEILSELYTAHPRQISVIISIARAAAMHGDRKKAIGALTYAALQGFDRGSALAKDTAFDSIRDDVDFKSVIASMSSFSDRLPPTRNFSPKDYWATNGWPNGTADQGQRYYCRLS